MTGRRYEQPSVLYPGVAAVLVILLSALIMGGCTPDVPVRPPVRTWKPVGEQLIDLDSRLRETPFRVLLSFETDNDLAFVSGLTQPLRDESILHTGPASLSIPAGTKTFAIKLSNLLPVTSFPGSWTLLGAYLYAKDSTRVNVSYEVDGKVLAQRTVTLSRRAWTPALIDVAPMGDPNSPPPPPPGILRFSFEKGAPSAWCDDVIVVENTRTRVTGDLAGDGWTIRERGFKTIIDRPGHFSLSVDTPEADTDAWQLEEASELRVLFAASGGRRMWTIYSDGRQYVNGTFSSLVQLPAGILGAMVEQHESPAEISVPEEMGRVERNSPGDRNNDGYAELIGAYQIKAVGPRLVMTIRPRTARLVRPLFEIAGFPAGRVTGTLEGVLVDKCFRLPDGHVLVELPGTIDREVTVELKVQ